MRPTREVDDLVKQAQYRARYVGSLIGSLQSEWAVAPGLPDLQRRIMALQLPLDDLETVVAEFHSVADLPSCKASIKHLAEAIKLIYQGYDLEHRQVLRRYLYDILAATYVLDQFIEQAVSEDEQLTAQPKSG